MKADAQTEAEVTAVLTRLSQAYTQRNSGDLLAVFAPDPDVVLIGTGVDEKRVGREEVKVQVERDWAQSERVVMELTPNVVSATGEVAWVSGDFTIKVTSGGQEVTMPGRITAVLEKREGKWLIAQAHFSMPFGEQGAGESWPTK